MTREQEVGDALSHGVLVPAVAAHQLALHDLGLHQQVVQVLKLLPVAFQLRGRRGLRRQGWEAELMQIPFRQLFPCKACG
jgi:hypothetical protein